MEKNIGKAYENITGYKEIIVTGFKKGDNVTVEYEMIFETFAKVNKTSLVQLLRTVVEDNYGTLGGFQIDEKSIKVTKFERRISVTTGARTSDASSILLLLMSIGVAVLCLAFILFLVLIVLGVRRMK